MKLNFKVLLAKKERDENRRITHQEVAEYMGISNVTLSRMIHSPIKRIEIPQAEALMDFFNCGLDDLYYRIPNE